MRRRLYRYGDQSIIALALSVLGLLGLDHSNDARLDQTAWENRLIHEQQYVQWIAIISQSAGD